MKVPVKGVVVFSLGAIIGFLANGLLSIDEQIDEDAENVLGIIEEFDGVLPFTDKASPEVIKREFGLSKAAFKRAVGHLLKEKKIKIQDKRIYLIF